MIPLYKPHMPKLPELDRILHSGHIAYGEYARRFESVLSDYFGGESVLATNTLELAHQVVIDTLELKPEDEIIASPMGCLASTQPYAARYINIRWSDVDPATGTLDPDRLKETITSETKAILHNHFCGYPGYIDEINAIGREYGIPVIDDGIEAFGSIYKDKKLGCCGSDVTIFSFQAVRLPTTMSGGAILFKEKGYHDKAVLVRDCGIDRSRYRDSLGEISPDYDVCLRGHSATINEAEAYIGLCQMEEIEELIDLQRKAAGLWDKSLRKGERPVGRKEILPDYWVYGLLAPDKEEAIRYYRDRGLYASGVHINNDRYTVFGKAETLPGVKEFYSRFVAVPSGWWTMDMGLEEILKEGSEGIK